MTTEDRVKRIVKKLPGKKGWQKSGNEVFVELGLLLIEPGIIDFEELESILHDLYWAVATEYGA